MSFMNYHQNVLLPELIYDEVGHESYWRSFWIDLHFDTTAQLWKWGDDRNTVSVIRSDARRCSKSLSIILIKIIVQILHTELFHFIH